jgi:pyrroline-5-carboxylate reductase
MRFAFLGGGVMAEALIRAILARDLATPDEIVVADPVEARRAALAALGVRATHGNPEAAAGAGVVVLAVKPGIVPEALRSLAEVLTPAQLVVSIAAGVTVGSLESLVPAGVPVVRVMPNTPAQVGAGASAFCRGTHAGQEHAARVTEFLSAAGVCVEVPETLMDAVTGLSGSGPAFVCLVIEALADGGVQAGLPRPVAQTLAAQTVMGAGQLILQSGEHPAVWKDRVATPGGTTIAGLAALEAGGLRSALINAVVAATRRSRELSEPG